MKVNLFYGKQFRSTFDAKSRLAQ